MGNTIKKNPHLFENLFLTSPSHFTIDNQDIPSLGCVMDAPIIMGTSAQQDFQQLINQVQLVTKAVVAT